MATLEQMGATRLRAIPALTALLTGGIYESAKLGTEGITSATTTPAAYSGGLLLPTAILKARALVPTNFIRDLKERVADANQVLEVWIYERITTVAIEGAQRYIYESFEGHAFTGFWPCAWTFGLPPMPAPEMTGVMVSRIDFATMSVRRPIAV